MMLANKIHIDQCTGVSITLAGSNGLVIDGCTVLRREGKLDIDQRIPACSSLKELFEVLPAKSVISLNLNGRGIVHKQQETNDNNSAAEFDKILPGANPDDFYVQRFTSGNQLFTSVVRKTEADKLLEAFSEAGFTLVMLSLGPFPAETIWDQLNIYGEDLIFNGHHIRCNEKREWLSYLYKPGAAAPFPLKADMEMLQERMILPYAAAFQVVLVHKIDPVSLEVPVLHSNLSGLINDKKLKMTGLIILAVFFVLLAANTMVFSWLFTENGHLAEQLSRTSRDTEGIRELEEKLTRNELLLKDFGWDGGLNKSVIIDKVAALLPDGLTWRDIYINPVDLLLSRQEKAIRFSDRRLSITGNAAAVLDVNEWIARIKTMKWVKNARLESYTFNNELNTGQFKILLDY
jgi:hypothetical protein